MDSANHAKNLYVYFIEYLTFPFAFNKLNVPYSVYKNKIWIKSNDLLKCTSIYTSMYVYKQ